MDCLYCTVSDLIMDLGIPGADESATLRYIRAASDYITREFGGTFTPVTETLRMDGNGLDELFLPKPFTAVTSVVDDGDSYASGDYLLYPRNRHWANGPYTSIRHDPDGDYSAWTDEADIVVVSGRTALYEETVDTGATLDGAQDAAQTTLAMDNGAKLSVGANLLIDSEQELMTGWESPSAATTLGAAADTTGVSVTVADASLINVGEVIRVDLEQMYVIDRNTSSNQLAVTRGWNGTKSASHADAASVEVYRTATVRRGVNGTTAASHADGTSAERYLAPSNINWLARQIAALMKRKAESGFAGKTGNADLGAVFYHDEFPRFTIERLKKLYRTGRI